MNRPRQLTRDEAALLSAAAERLLRLADVELNLGEYVLQLLARAKMRDRGCARNDIASINSTVGVKMLGCCETLEFTLVTPRDADVSLRRISVLTPLGLAFIGRVVGDQVHVPLVTVKPGAATLLTVRRSPELN